MADTNSNKTYTELYTARYDNIFSGTDVIPTSFEWEVTFYKAPAIFTGTDTALLNGILNNEFKLKTISWTAPDIPDAQLNPIMIHGHRYSQPGMAPNYGAVTFQVQDTVNMNLHKYFTAIQYAMDDPITHSSQYRNPSNFVFGFYIDKLDPMGRSIKRWNCVRALLGPVATDVNTGSSDKNLQGRLTVTFNVDLFKIYYPENGKYPKADDGSNATW